MAKSIEKKLKRVESNLIGVWKFMERGKKPVWCTTFHHNGYYYDTRGKITFEDALEQVAIELKKLDNKKQKKK